MVKKLITFILLTGFVHLGFCQEDTTITLEEDSVLLIGKIDFDSNRRVPIDDQIDFIIFNDKNKDNGYADLGNWGTNNYNLDYSLRLGVPNGVSDLGFRELWQSKSSEAYGGFYYVSQPLTRLSYINGPSKLLEFDALHTQNISENWNFAINYSQLSSEGLYINQNNKVGNLGLTSLYGSLNRKYRGALSVNYQWDNSEDNGGILEDSLFFDNSSTTGSLGIKVNLNDASHKSSVVKVGYNQDYLLSDSLSVKEVRVYANSSLAVRQLRYLDYINDADSTDWFFYEDRLGIDMTVSVNGDSIYDDYKMSTVANEVGVSVMDAEGISGKVFVRNSFSHQNELDNHDTTFSETWIGTNLHLNRFNSDFNIKGLYGVEGVNLGGYYLGIEALHSWNKLKGVLSYDLLSEKPDYFKLYYHSESRSWRNNFDFTVRHTGKFTLNYSNFLMGSYSISNVKDDVIYGQNGIPILLDDYSLNTLKLSVYKRNSKWDAGVNYTLQTSDALDSLGMPENLISAKILRMFRIGSNGIVLGIGGQVVYTTEYQGYEYDPITGQFFLNSNKEDYQRLGNYPNLDLMAVMQIKTFTAMLKVINVLEGVASYNYMQVNHYPQFDRGFMLNLSWDLLN